MGRLKRGAIVLFTLLGIAVIAVGVPFLFKYRDAGEMVATLPTYIDELKKEPSRIYSSDNQLLYQISSEFREPVRLRDVPKVMQNAMIAAEDKRFWTHNGVDIRALARIAVGTASDGGHAPGGASTISMQIAKRLFSKGQRSMDRKLQDIAVAYRLEQQLTKEQILELYLNQVYFGAGAYGVKAAAEVYFNKSLDKLTLAEAAMLARCVRRPSDETPFLDLKRSIENRNTVLAIMREEGMITEGEYQSAKKEEVHLSDKRNAASSPVLRAPYFVQHVLDELHEQMPDVDLRQGGYTVYTTINTQMQAIAEHEVRRVVHENAGSRVKTGAFVLMDRDGQILAEVGGVDYRRNKYNVVTQGRRQPGSSFKPITYATALQKGAISVDDYISNDRFILRDPITGKTWEPKNSGGRYGGSVSVTTAFKMSMNIPAVRVMEKVGPPSVVEFAHGVFGFQSELSPYLSLALGTSAVRPIEMAQAYSVFMTHGQRVTPFTITRVEGPDGNVTRFSPKIYNSGLDPTVCDEMDTLLRQVVESGTATRASGVPNARGKTGTTQDNRDAWFCGYTDGLVGIGWISNEQKDKKGRWIYPPMGPRVFGGTVTVQFWASIMAQAYPRFAHKLETPEEPVVETEEPKKSVEPKGPTIDDYSDQQIDPDKPASDSQDLGPKPKPNPPLEPDQNDGASTTGGEIVPSADTPPKPAGRRDGGSRKPPPPPPEYVEVEICADSHMRAGIYCPETVFRTFRKGTEPKKVCDIHHP